MQRHFDFPVVVRLHGPHYLNNFEEKLSAVSAARLKRESKSFRAANFVTSPSDSVLSLTRDKYGHAWTQAQVIPNSILPAPAERRWNLSEVNRYQILFVGRFDNHKGADILFDALAKVYQRAPQVRLVFVGPDRGVIKNGVRYDMAAYAKTFLPSLPIDDVVFNAGLQDKKTIAAYRQSSHVTVIASRYETFGNVALEALSVGSPLVCSNAGALPEIVVDNQSGLLFDSENADSLSDRLLSLLEGDELCQSVATGGYQRVVEQFSPIETAGRLVSFFDKAVVSE